MKMGKLKRFVLIYEDKNKNELTRTYCREFNLKEAKRRAKNEKAYSRLNDLHKIIVKLSND